ncbi:hypothetical protein [Clostridium sp. KNHs214]|uniref:hypothetical protein n=1 Tax=Clostridium sp. KNHs214 TaxID=1540257 RepID=UPI0005559140|nr:hypothetical protein [Clostridium sp. KNHs214]
MKTKKLMSAVLAVTLMASGLMVGCDKKSGDKGGSSSKAKMDKEHRANAYDFLALALLFC